MGRVQQQLLRDPHAEPPLAWINTLTGHVGNTKYGAGATSVAPAPY